MTENEYVRWLRSQATDYQQQAWRRDPAMYAAWLESAKARYRIARAEAKR